MTVKKLMIVITIVSYSICPANSIAQSKDNIDAVIKNGLSKGILKRNGYNIVYLSAPGQDTGTIGNYYRQLIANSGKPYRFSFQDNKNLQVVRDPIRTKPISDTTKKQFVPVRQPERIAANIRYSGYLRNGDFEMGTHRTIPGWTIEGRSFRLENGTAQQTWSDFDIISETTIGGDYWKDIPYHTGFRNKRWISSMGEGILGNPDAMNGAKGTLTSDPFKLMPGRSYISFLISGGDNINMLKIELLEQKVSIRLRGNVVAGPQPVRPIHGTTRPNDVGTVNDTTWVPINGIEAKTGHNNDIFRRDMWDLRSLDTSKLYVIRVTDSEGNASNKWAHINIDDIRMDEKNLLLYATAKDSTRIQKIPVKDLLRKTSKAMLVDYYTPLHGSADMHTHLMSHLGMGNKLLHGAPDIGSLLPPGTFYKDAGFDVGETKPDCNAGPVRATSVAEALGSCNATHGGWGTDNNCGNHLRAAILNMAFDHEYEFRVPLEQNGHGDHPHAGYPNFATWPHFSSTSHQQMYVDWIRRAYEGGLRVLVTLTVNSELLGAVLEGDGPMDDKSTADLQLDEIAKFVTRHNDFMELAYDAEDMRRIIKSNKLAVMMGMEVDNIGNFNYGNVTTNQAAVKAEIERLYRKGVRYIFPIHLVNNKFGGSAVYSALFNFSNKFTNSRPLPLNAIIPPGLMFKVQPATDPNITFSLNLLNAPSGSINALIATARPIFEGLAQTPYPPATGCFPPRLGCLPQFKIASSLLVPDAEWELYAAIKGGQQNVQGLTPMGEFAIKEMMKLGMVIDVDHMSEKSVTRTLALADDFEYPVASGHNGMRDGGASENQRSPQQLTAISNLGGVFGVGVSGQTSDQYLRYFRLALTRMNGAGVTMGSDINGFVTMQRPRFKDNSVSGNRLKYRTRPAGEGLVQYRFANKTWDYNTDGMAHIGLYPDFYQDLKNVGMTRSERQVFFSAAEYVVTMWEKCERSKVNVR